MLYRVLEVGYGFILQGLHERDMERYGAIWRSLEAHVFTQGGNMLSINPLDFESLVKRVSALEAELKAWQETEWDRHWIIEKPIHIHEIIPGIGYKKLTYEEREHIFRQEYLRRLVACRAARGTGAGITS